MLGSVIMGPALGSGTVPRMMGLVVLAFLLEVGSAGPPREHFVFQWKPECLFTNGTQRVRYVDRYIFGRQEFVRFDSDVGEYEAVTPLGEFDARVWNSQKEHVEHERSQVQCCRHNYRLFQPIVQERRVRPRVKITPSEDSSSSSSSSSPRRAVLICDVAGFWPSAIKVTWLRNGEEEVEGDRVFHTDLTCNGDWTFQLAVMLETPLDHGDVYTCRVEDASLPEPLSIHWEPDSSRSQMWTGVAGFVLGLAFLAPGLALYVKTKKGQVLHQPPAAAAAALAS